jgi:four helix bundle protein
MALVRRFEDLAAWQEARKLTAAAYALTADRTFGRDAALIDQIRRAAVSCMNNIAEGFDSGSRSEFRRFLRYAVRSASEVQSCLYVALDRSYVDQAAFSAAYEGAEAVRRLWRPITSTGRQQDSCTRQLAYSRTG